MNAAPSRPDHTSPWFTSSYSNGAGGECVECAWSMDSVLVRDSMRPDGPVMAFRSHSSWRAFIAALRSDALI